jgi:hypothetical protein
MKNLREERKIVLFPPLGLANVTICLVVVHRHLALSVKPVML